MRGREGSGGYRKARGHKKVVMFQHFEMNGYWVKDFNLSRTGGNFSGLSLMYWIFISSSFLKRRFMNV
jgi:hypothetical protein